MATNITNLYGDYSPTIDRNRTVTILGGFQRTPNLIYYGAGCNDNKCQDYDSSQIKEAVQFAQVIVVCLGTGIAPVELTIYPQCVEYSRLMYSFNVSFKYLKMSFKIS